jgi:hypothetical protein
MIKKKILETHSNNIIELSAAIQAAGGSVWLLDIPDVKEFLMHIAMNGIEISAKFTAPIDE